MTRTRQSTSPSAAQATATRIPQPLLPGQAAAPEGAVDMTMM